MKKIFISQPMRGLTDEEIKARRDMIIKNIEESDLVEEGYEILDTVIPPTDSPDVINRPVWCLGRSIQLLAQADYVYFADGWQSARGCVIEHTVAKEYGITIIHD